MSNHDDKVASASPVVTGGGVCHVTADVTTCVCFSLSVIGDERQHDSR